MSTMTVSEARAALPRILDRVVAGEEVTITRHGKAVAVIVRPESLRARRAEEALAEAAAIRGFLEKGRTERLRARPSLTAQRADELAADVRTARSSR